jgi:response regulator NasT
LHAALVRAAEIRELQKKESQLETALAANREVAMALGLLMERKRIDRKQAFELLRTNARSNRRSMEAVAKELLAASEKLNLII